MVKNGIFEGIYQSEQGQPAKNTGYVKIGRRQDDWHLKIDIRGFYSDTVSVLEVCYFICRDLKTYIFPVGVITVKNGMGQAELLLKNQEKLPSNYRFEYADGLYVGDWKEEGELLSAVWDHRDAQQQKREIYREETKEKEQQRQEQQKRQEQQERQEQGAENTAPLPFIAPKAAAVKTSVQASESSEAVLKDRRAAQEPSVKTAEVVPQIQMIPTRREKTLIERFEDEECRDIFNDDEFTDCMEITPQQLQEMTGVEIPMASNSFLLHAFFKYHHILLARPTDPQKENMVFIGAPGIYSNRERYLASLFGLRNFKKSHRSDYKNPNFGYWYAEIYI